jgi:hypothetical protein
MWYEELKRWLTGQGWMTNEDAACVYILKAKSESIGFVLYVHAYD